MGNEQKKAGILDMRLQELEPVSAHLCLDIEKSCKSHFAFAPGSRLLLALSGGADSMAMAMIFHILSPRLKLSLCACHINHHLRPEADADAEFVSSFCHELGIACLIADVDVSSHAKKKHCGIEEAGREIRLQMLEESRLAQNASWILMAHHAGDLAEDILMRLTRGAGWPALGGMHWKNGAIARPLLHTEPRKLREFLISSGYSWREDESNQSLEFKRNRFRHVVLPILRCENPSLDANFCRLNDLARIDDEYWQNCLADALSHHPWQIGETESGISLLLPAALLRQLLPAARLRLYFRALAYLRDYGQNRADTLLRLERAYKSGIGGKQIQCSGGITAYCCKAGIKFQKKTAGKGK